MKPLEILKKPALVLLILSPIYTRGLFEIIFRSKPLPYLIQLVAIILFLVLIAGNSRIVKKGVNQIFIALLFLFIAVLTVSSTITAVKYSYMFEIAVFSSILLFLFSLFLFSNIAEPEDKELPRTVANALFVIGCILVAAATFEQLTQDFFFQIRDIFTIPIFPGNRYHFNVINVLRPASLTGSMLHYPILMPLIGVIVFRFARENYKKWISAIFVLSPFVTFSRSGILISVIIILFYIADTLLTAFINRNRNRRPNIRRFPKKWLFAGGLTAAVLVFLFFNPQTKVLMNTIVARIFAFQDTGNNARYSIWSDTIDVFLKSNIFLGEFTGMLTNTIKNIFGQSHLILTGVMKNTVTESGFLEILTSTGVLGTCVYYLVFILSFIQLYFYKKEKLLAYSVLAVIAQTFFYQSTEVLPFMFTLSLIPYLAAADPKNADNRPGIPR